MNCATQGEITYYDFGVKTMQAEYLWKEKAPFQTDFRPFIECYPFNGARSAILICPGGGYEFKSVEHEGREFAMWFNVEGYSAYVLEYRVFPCHKEAPLCDARRALRLIRSKGYEKVAIMGFSAGGNLACCAAEYFDNGDKLAEDGVERFSSRPDALISCYSVVSFGEYTHEGSVRALLGAEADRVELRNRFSAQKNVRPDSPPAFIWHTAEDTCVPAENSLMLAMAYQKQKIPFEIHIFPTGSHGLGMAKGIPGTDEWPQMMLKWLKREGI